MEIDDSIDWKAQKALVNDRLLDSFAVISLIAELEEQFDIDLNSVDAIWKMIQRLKEN